MKTKPEAKVIADSVSPEGHRLTTFELTMHRYALAEFNTHRVFSRNSASSRAIPVAKQLARVMADPAIPLEFGTNQPGMQAGAPLEGLELGQATYLWLKARDAAYQSAERLSSDLNVHKQVANRLLEPWMWHKVIVTATEWENFFRQRYSFLALPEIYKVAAEMHEVFAASVPKELHDDEWHTPYADETLGLLEHRVKLSVARCARVSYLTHDGRVDIEADLKLYERLVTADPPHASPLEHVATPYPENVAKIARKDGSTRGVPILGNFLGWYQERHRVAGERIAA